MSERAQVHGRRGCGERLIAVADRLADEAVLVGGAQQSLGVVGCAIRRARTRWVRTPSSADRIAGLPTASSIASSNRATTS